jgi:hypothetical protein
VEIGSAFLYDGAKQLMKVDLRRGRAHAINDSTLLARAPAQL